MSQATDLAHTVGATPAPSREEELGRAERILMEHECLRQVKVFYQILDAHDHLGALAMLAPDIVWFRAGKTLTGLDAARSALATRNPEMHIRHLVLNDTVHVVSAVEAIASYCVVAYRVDVPLGASNPPATPRPSVFDCTDRLVLTPGGWRFAFKDAVPVFLKPRP